MVSDSGKVMATPSFRFLYHCAGVEHNQWIICYIYSPRARLQANIKKKIYSWPSRAKKKKFCWHF